MVQRLGLVFIFCWALLQPITAQSLATARASIANAKSGASVPCAKSGAGLYKCEFRGTSQGVDPKKSRLLLWLKPTKPAGEGGFYLQRNPNGVSDTSPSGNWTGLAQLGNESYPPHNGDTFEIALSLVTADEAERLANQTGVVMKLQPDGQLMAIAQDLRVTLK